MERSIFEVAEESCILEESVSYPRSLKVEVSEVLEMLQHVWRDIVGRHFH